MGEELPLSEFDRERLVRKARRARGALRICACLGGVVPFTLFAFVCITPTELVGATAVLALVVCLASAVPFLAKGLDARRCARRADRWLEQDQKRRLVGEVTGKGPHFMVTVDGFAVAAWEKARGMSVGDAVTVEYLPLDSELAGILGVLRIDDEPNPYFESAWRSGPPTA